MTAPFSLRQSFPIALLVVALAGTLMAEGKWYRGKGAAVGSDFRRMRHEAVQQARADALRQAGITMKASTVRVQSEKTKSRGKGESVDFFSQFAESASQGIILDERAVQIGDPKRVSPLSEQTNVLYQIDASLEALVAVPEGKSDRTFAVSLKSDKAVYEEEEPVRLTVESTHDGWLTIFNIRADSLFVLLPNALSKGNRIEARIPFRFPPPNVYDFTLFPEPDEEESSEEFIAVVSRDSLPIVDVSRLSLQHGELELAPLTLLEYSNWLFNVPLDRRSSSGFILRVAKKQR